MTLVAPSIANVQTKVNFSSVRAQRGLNLLVLDALRGLAALYVVLHHARWLLWASQREFIASGAHGIGLAFATLSSTLIFGHQAVMFFFLLSGFCIHYRQAKSLSSGRGTNFDAWSFAIRRIRRLYPMLVVALVLTAALDLAGTRVNPDFYAGNASAQTIQAAMSVPSYSPDVIIGNLLMQGGLAVPTFGTNLPLWSLAYEAWFYLLYPVLLLLTTRIRGGGMVLAIGAISLIALLFPQILPVPAWLGPVLTYWIVWAVGAGIAEIYAGRSSLRGLPWVGMAGAVGSAWALLQIALQHADVSTVQTSDELVLGIALGAMLAYGLVGLPSPMAHLVERVARRFRWLGDMSYSLYVVHYPWLTFLSALWLSGRNQLPFGAELAIGGVVTSLGLSWCCWYLVERHFVGSGNPTRQPRSVVTAPIRVVGLNSPRA